VENVNAQVDELIATGVLRRLLAFTELNFSNSMIEAWWRSLKHQWLFLHLEPATPAAKLDHEPAMLCPEVIPAPKSFVMCGLSATRSQQAVTY
jgi:hypothetical protein